MEIIQETKNMFNAYFKIMKKQPTKNPDSNFGIVNLVKSTLVLPSNLEESIKRKIFEHLMKLQMCITIYSSDPFCNKTDEIESIFNEIINLYETNTEIVNWYENEYKPFLMSIAHEFETNQYVYVINNLQFHSSSYLSIVDRI